MAKHRLRLDRLLVNRKLAPSRERAQSYIMAGKVSVNGKVIAKAGHMVTDDGLIELSGHDHNYVSRGGLKLEGALRHFNLNPQDLTCVDVGSSTGGFTQCLLNGGAKQVFAIDVGHGQLDWSLRQDQRVKVMERTNFRSVNPNDIGQPIDLITIDVSFISLRHIIPQAVSLLAKDGLILALIKPQFEASRDAVESGGRITDPKVHQQAIQSVCKVANEYALQFLGVEPSQIRGKKSLNQEFFGLWLRPTIDANQK